MKGSHNGSTPRYWVSKCSYYFDIWQASQKQYHRKLPNYRAIDWKSQNTVLPFRNYGLGWVFSAKIINTGSTYTYKHFQTKSFELLVEYFLTYSYCHDSNCLMLKSGNGNRDDIQMSGCDVWPVYSLVGRARKRAIGGFDLGLVSIWIRYFHVYVFT